VNVGGRERTSGFELTRIVPTSFFYSVLEGARK
jgi:hypothetical protein